MARPCKPWLKSRDNCWWVTLNGKKVNLGVRGAQNEAAAWAEFNRLRSGQPQVPVQQPPTPTATVQQVVDEYLKGQAERVGVPVLKQNQLYLLPFSKRFGHLPAGSITSTQVDSYSRHPNGETLRKKWSESTRSKFLAVVKAAFRFAEESRLIDRSPLTGLKRPPVASRTEEVLLTEEEYQALHQAASAVFRPIFRFIWLQGCRPSEAARLTAADVRWQDSVAVLRTHKTQSKTGKSRLLYLTDDALSLLREQATKYPTGPLFRNRLNNPWTWVALGYAMRAARKKAGLESKVLYGLRHSWATEALANGVSDSMTAELLGQKGTRTLHANYSHLKVKTKALTEAARKVRGKVGDPPNSQPHVLIPTRNVIWAETLVGEEDS